MSATSPVAARRIARTSLRGRGARRHEAPDKNDITNAFAAAYRDDNSLVLAFGADRHAVNGDARWASGSTRRRCASPAPAAPVPRRRRTRRAPAGSSSIPDGCARGSNDRRHSGHRELRQRRQHRHGNVYRWNGTEPVQVLTTTGQDCKNTSYPSNFCTTSNMGASAGAPVAVQRQGRCRDDDYEASAFIEGFIDLGSIIGAGTCSRLPGRDPVVVRPGLRQFARRNAQGLRAEELPALRLDLVTTPKDGTGAGIPTGGLFDHDGTGRSPSRDEAAVTVTGITTWSGTVSFWLCGPLGLPRRERVTAPR